jgi:hypothetical protein
MQLTMIYLSSLVQVISQLPQTESGYAVSCIRLFLVPNMAAMQNPKSILTIERKFPTLSADGCESRGLNQ